MYIYMYIYPGGNGHNLYLYNSLCTYLYINLDSVSVQGSWGHTGFSDNWVWVLVQKWMPHATNNTNLPVHRHQF